jgi:SM-20-related protein
MEKDFEELISGFLSDRIGISDHFLSEVLGNQLKNNLLDLSASKQFKAAGIGNEDLREQNLSIRSDGIYWLDRENRNIHQNDFFDLMDAFVTYLNMTCFTGITDYEFHYSLYETGSFYKKHLDQFKSNSNRQFSMISYLNADWLEADGGQLLIHSEGGQQKIDPVQGRTVFFKSDDLEHEVLVANKRRLSVTGWLKRG